MMNIHSDPSDPGNPNRGNTPRQPSADSTPLNYDNVLVDVGSNTWYAPSVMTLMANGFPLTTYLHRHAKGDPGETAVRPNEIMAAAMLLAEGEYPVISAYYDQDFHVMICFLTDEDREMTYCFSIQCP